MKPITEIRSCLNCDSKTTRLKLGKYPQWFKHKNGFLCHKCYNKLISNPKWYPVTNPKRIMFKPIGQQISIEANPRTGQCSKCLRKIGEGIKRTAMHHIEYHDEDPLKDTIELCNRCHRKQHSGKGE